MIAPPAPESSPLPPARTGAAGVQVHSAVPYASLDGARPLELDLYLSPSEKDCPAVVFIHGGGWRMGSRRAVGPLYAGASPSPFEQLAQAGIAVASMDYRLSGEAVWPAQLHDVRSALAWVRSRAPELRVDPTRLATWGESAGGHLALMAALTEADDAAEDADGPSGGAPLAACVAWYPPADLAALPADLGADPSATDTREALLLGAALDADPERTADASPITHVTGAAPRTLLLHGEADPLIPAVQSERLADRMADAGVDVRRRTYPGAGHLWLDSPDAAAAALAETIAFLTETLQTETLQTETLQSDWETQ